MEVIENLHNGDGSQVLFAFTFPYIKESHVKASIGGVATTAFTFNNATTLQFTEAPAAGSNNVRIYRETDNEDLASTFYAGSAIRAKDLNDNLTQNLYVTQEYTATAASATSTANTAKTTADSATTTANAADTKADTAITTANAADTIADTAKLATDRIVATTADGGSTWTLKGNNTNASTDPKGVGYAVTTSEAANTTAASANTSAGNANTTAATANSTANTANATANTASTNASNAVSTANSATTTANTASTNATTAISTANTASTNATNAVSTANTASTNASAAVATANAASAAVADAVIFTPKADKAALEGFAPSEDGYYEISNTTDLANGTWTYSSVTYTLANIPGTFQGAAYLGMKLSYTHSNKTFTYMSYNASDPENRYIANTRPFITGTPGKTFVVKVAAKNAFHRYNGTGASDGFTIDGEQAPFLTFTPGVTYQFDQADSSNSGHPLVFYEESDKTTQYTTNITSNGTPGSAAAYTRIVTTDSIPTILHYQCSNHAYMGNAVQCNTAFDRTALAIIDGGNFDSSSSTASMTNSYDGGNFDS